MTAVIAILTVFALDLSLTGLGANGQFSPPFRFDGLPPPEPARSTLASVSSDDLDNNQPASSSSSTSDNNSNSSQPLVWQPLRATFRPLNRPASPAPPVPLALSLGTEPIPGSSSSSFEPSDSGDAGNRFGSSPSGGDLPTVGLARELASGSAENTIAAANSGPTVAPASSRDTLDSEDLPTRVPLNRFRPTKVPSADPQTQPTPSAASFPLAPASRSRNLTSTSSSSLSNRRVEHLTSECLECICEASTNCNSNSRCQTSDVRHTRCGMFLISYDQWLETGLSKELVSAEALAQDSAADERAFYECVTNRDCAERLLTIYANRQAKDCDRDGRIDCYDVAAVHQGGLNGCRSETLLDSQYWSDFNACFGFGR